MAWKGFITESKSYMGYPGSPGNTFNEIVSRDVNDRDQLWEEYQKYKKQWFQRLRKKIKFWRAFPLAWLRYVVPTVMDWWRRRQYV